MTENVVLFFQIYGLAGKYPLLDKLMVFGAQYLIAVTASAILILALRGGPKERKSVILIVISTAISIVLTEVIRAFYFEPRPFVTYSVTPLIKHAVDASFPSTHTLAMTVIAFSYAFYRSKWSPFFLIALIWVGFARIFVGIHYPGDILGGIAIGFVSVAIGWQIKSWLKRTLL